MTNGIDRPENTFKEDLPENQQLDDSVETLEETNQKKSIFEFKSEIETKAKFRRPNLETFKDLINNKIYCFYFNPVFLQISSKFDEGGYDGLLVNLLDKDHRSTFKFNLVGSILEIQNRLILEESQIPIKKRGINIFEFQDFLIKDLENLAVFSQIADFRQKHILVNFKKIDKSLLADNISHFPSNPYCVNSFTNYENHKPQISLFKFDKIIPNQINNFQDKKLTNSGKQEIDKNDEYVVYPFHQYETFIENENALEINKDTLIDLSQQLSMRLSALCQCTNQVFSASFDLWKFLEPETWTLSFFKRKTNNFVN